MARGDRPVQRSRGQNPHRRHNPRNKTSYNNRRYNDDQGVRQKS